MSQSERTQAQKRGEHRAPNADSRHRIRAAQISLFYEVPSRVFAHAINGGLVVAVLWGDIATPYLIAWYVPMVLITALRLVGIHRFRTKQFQGRNVDAGDLERWAFWGIVGTSASAAMWGASCAIFWLTPDIIDRVFVIFAGAGMTVGAVATTYPLILSTRLFVVLFGGPFIVSMFLVGDRVYAAMGVMALLFAYLLLRQARAANAMLMRSLALQEENRALVGELSVARDHLEERVEMRTAELDTANENLRAEMAARFESEARLQQAQKMEAIGQLTGGIAHDFNNLLAVIQGNAELLAEQIESEAGKREVAAVLRASERGAGLTQRLLAFSRRQALQPKAIDVNELIASMTKMLGRTIGLGTEVEFVPEPHLDSVSVDPGQLENAILNLAINARDAMRGSGTVKITTNSVVLSTDGDIQAAGTSPQPIVPGRYVVIALSDTGVGIAPDVLDKVWEPFFTTKPVGEGTGLGLSMVYGFVQQSGGRVTIDSTVGKGTTVRIFLPRIHAAAEPKDRPEPDGSVPHGTETVLVIEDDVELRELVEYYLRRLGYNVHCAAGAEETYEALAKFGKPEMILSDVVLGGGHRGPVLVENARRRFGPIKAIFMSGYAAGTGPGEVWAGEDEILIDKPFELSLLARCIRDILDDKGQGTDQ